MLLLLADTNFKHRLTDLHLSKLIMTVLTFRDISKFPSVNKAIVFVLYGLVINQSEGRQTGPYQLPYKK